MPTYRVLSGERAVIYLFSADDDQEAERFARELCRRAQLDRPPGQASCVHMESLAGEEWQQVCAWRRGG